MKANELRLGNYVLIHNPKSHPNLLHQPVQVVGIQSINDIYFPNSNTSISVEIDVYNGFSQFNEFIKPISLTQKWLLDFGFQRYGFVDKPTQFRFKDRLIVYRDGFLYDYGTSVKLEYVHQLQNLYFALTREELIYKK